MRITVVGAAAVERLVSMPAAIDRMRVAFRELSDGEAVVPLRTPVDVGRGITLFMPGWLPGARALGGKVVSVFGGDEALGLPAVHAVVLLVDPSTGVPRALLDGTTLTRLRTGAATGLATDLLARPEARVLTLFGAGGQARAQIAAVRCVRSVDEVRLYTPPRSDGSERSAERLARELHADPGSGAGSAPRVVVAPSPSQAVRGADVIVCATDSRTPVFRGADVDEGAHVNGIGSFTPEMREVDETLVRRSTVFVDSREAALAEAGDLIVPLREGAVGEEHVRAELGDVLAGRHPGRSRPGEITFFKSVGSAAQDLALAAFALAEAERRGEGETVEL